MVDAQFSMPFVRRSRALPKGGLGEFHLSKIRLEECESDDEAGSMCRGTPILKRPFRNQWCATA